MRRFESPIISERAAGGSGTSERAAGGSGQRVMIRGVVPGHQRGDRHIVGRLIRGAVEATLGAVEATLGAVHPTLACTTRHIRRNTRRKWVTGAM